MSQSLTVAIEKKLLASIEIKMVDIDIHTGLGITVGTREKDTNLAFAAPVVEPASPVVVPPAFTYSKYKSCLEAKISRGINL